LIKGEANDLKVTENTFTCVDFKFDEEQTKVRDTDQKII
jgi:hypothetical protein